MVLTGCTGLPGTGDKGYVTGTGVVRQIEPAERGDPVDLEAETIDGEPIDLADYRGAPVVVVVWGSWCVPCRAEQPEVNAAAEELGETAQFVGINLREPSLDDARAFVRGSGVDYPSIDANDGRALLAFQGTLSPYTIPAFVVLDDEGRAAASIVGSLPSELTLVDLTRDVAAEGEPTPAPAAPASPAAPSSPASPGPGDG